MLYLTVEEINYIKRSFEAKLSKYNIVRYNHNDTEEVLILDDSLVLFIQVKSRYAYSRGEDYRKKYYSLFIEEATYNDLGFKYNHTKFIKEICVELNIDYINYQLANAEGSCVIYTKFRGWSRDYWKPNTPSIQEYINKEFPEVCLKERYNIWDGLLYYIIVIEFEKKDGGIVRGCAYTRMKPYQYMNSQGNRFIKKGNLSNEIRISLNEFNDFKRSWKGNKRQFILEEHMKYFFFEKNFREKNDIWRYADSLLKMANVGTYDFIPRSTYLRPQYRWKTEELVLKITKKLYSKYNVIYQYKPFYLKSSLGGQMSYDIFIQELSVAIEYQGEQHFRPIDYFGGEESFYRQRERDEEKKKISEKYGIKLVYINFNDNITSDLIKKRVEGRDI